MAEEKDEDEMFSVTRGEWREVLRIAREDGMHIHKTYDAFMKSKETKTPPEGEIKEGDDKSKQTPAGDAPTSGEGNPPPVKDEPIDKPKKKGLWWGNREDD